MSSAIPCSTVQLLPGPCHESMHCFRIVMIVHGMLVCLLCLATVGKVCVNVYPVNDVGTVIYICRLLDGILMLMQGYLTCKFITRPSGCPGHNACCNQKLSLSTLRPLLLGLVLPHVHCSI